MAELARVAGIAGAAAMPEASAAGAFVEWLSRLKADLGIPATLSALRSARPVTRADIPALIEVAITDTCHRTNPRPCTRADFDALFARAIGD
jgi:alcohol dehydrogenase class IV